MDWMISQKMNAEQMTLFLSQVSAAHPEDFIVMWCWTAPVHKTKGSSEADSIGSSPAPMPLNSNPGHLWDELRKNSQNRVFDDLAT